MQKKKRQKNNFSKMETQYRTSALLTVLAIGLTQIKSSYKNRVKLDIASFTGPTLRNKNHGMVGTIII